MLCVHHELNYISSEARVPVMCVPCGHQLWFEYTESQLMILGW